MKDKKFPSIVGFLSIQGEIYWCTDSDIYELVWTRCTISYVFPIGGQVNFETNQELRRFCDE